MSVGLILVSHSRDLAAGTAELAQQMAPSVLIATAGGTDDGGLGTSFDEITAAVGRVAELDGAVLLYDLGSAVLTAETALEFADSEVAARIRIVDAPLVEGALAAAVTAEGGGDLAAVAQAAVDAGAGYAAAGAGSHQEPGTGSAAEESGGTAQTPDATAEVAVINPLGLHARPAAALVRALGGWEAHVSIGRPGGSAVDLRSILRVVSLALRGGDTAVLTGWGPDARAAVDVVRDLIRTGFGETAGAGARLAPTAMGAAPARMGNTPAPRSTSAGRTPPSIRDGVLTAQAGAPGLAIGPLVRLDRTPLHFPAPPTGAGAGFADPQRQLDLAIRTAERKLAAGNEFQAAHAALLADPELRAAAVERLRSAAGRAIGAAAAWWSAVVGRADVLAHESDELVAARAVDLREAGTAVLAELGIVVDRIPPDLDGAIVVTDELGPGEVPVLVERGAVGVVLSRSSLTAHAVIVARGLGLPMVLRAGNDLSKLPAGTELVLDGDAGTVQIRPSIETAGQVRERIDSQRQAAELRMAAAAAPVVLADGRQISVMANIGSLADARAAVRNGADGVGLLRTELLVLDRDTYPDEDIQQRDLRDIFEVLGTRPVVVRVLDAGGDKPVTALNLDREHNGFLGLRGLRYLLVHPDLLRTQLRAIFRAAVGHRVSVMAPMVSIASEVTAFHAAVTDAVSSLRASGHSYQEPEQIGVMVEVPSAALAADEICAECDFISVGSNDLTSYLMAADRTVTEVADLLDPRSTAVQRALDMICDYATKSGTPVAVCGEIAGMVEQAPRLVGRGVHELSVAPARIPVIKELLRARK